MNAEQRACIESEMRILERDSLYTYHAHYAAAKFYGRVHTALSFVATLAAASVTVQLIMKAGLGGTGLIILSLFATITALLQSTLETSKRSLVHKNAGDDMLCLYKNIVATALNPQLMSCEDCGPILQAAAQLRAEMASINSKYPMTPRFAFAIAKKSVERTPPYDNVRIDGTCMPRK